MANEPLQYYINSLPGTWYLQTSRLLPFREKNGLFLLLNAGDHQAHDPEDHSSPDHDFVGRFLQA
jgi:hypothetical protein